MNNIFRTSFFFALILGAIACNKRLDNYDLEYSGDKLVLFGNISNELGVTVYLTHTLPPTGTYYFDEISVEVTGATIVLSENDVAIDTLTELEPGTYFLSYSPVPGNSYSLSCEASGFETVYSTSVVFPEPIDLASVIFSSGFEDQNGDPACSVRPLFTDEVSNDNFYAFGFSFFIDDDFYVGNIYETPDADPLGCESGVFVFNNSFLKLYSDNCFSGTAFPFTFISNIVLHETEIIPFDRFEFSTCAISKELSDFVSNQSETSGINLLFSDPKLNYTNITNGFGVFWAQNDTTFVYHF